MQAEYEAICCGGTDSFSGDTFSLKSFFIFQAGMKICLMVTKHVYKKDGMYVLVFVFVLAVLHTES